MKLIEDPDELFLPPADDACVSADAIQISLRRAAVAVVQLQRSGADQQRFDMSHSDVMDMLSVIKGSLTHAKVMVGSFNA